MKYLIRESQVITYALSEKAIGNEKKVNRNLNY